MNLPDFAVRRPTTILMFVLAFMVMGFVSLFKLPVELYPNTSFGEISIVIYVRGQIPPTEVESQVTRLVEEAVSTVAHLHQLMSITKEGESTVVLSFEPGTNMDFAAMEVREKFAKIKSRLPKEIEKPVIAQFKQTDVPVMIVALTSPHRTPEAIRKMVDQWVKERFKRVAGVANVETAGGRERKILVEIDQQKLVAYGVSMDEITGTLSANNLNLLSGEIKRTEDKLLVRMMGEFDNIDQIKNISIRRLAHNSVLRLEDVATVKDGYLDAQEYSRINVQDTVTIYIQKESTKNTISVVADLLKEIDGIKEKLPKDVQLVITSNQATFIEKAIHSLKDSLMRGVLLIVLVLFLFLYDMTRRSMWILSGLLLLCVFAPLPVLYVLAGGLAWVLARQERYRPVVIVITPIPVAVVTTFLFMRFGGLSLNVMTLFGLALGVGMLVDNSIVVFDSILKKREAGLDVKGSAVEGTLELMVAIVASTLTHVIVFLPMIFLSKDIQLLYSSMALTIVFSLMISLFCAIALTPLMSSKAVFSKPMAQMNPDKTGDLASKILPRERKIVRWVIRKTPQVIVAMTLIFVVGLVLMNVMPSEYLGTTDQNKFTAFVEMPTGTKLDVSNDIVKKVETMIKEVPEVKTFTSRIEPWSSKIYVELLPATERKRSVAEVIEAIRSQTERLEPAFIYFEEEDSVGTKEIVVEVYGFDYKTLRQLAIGITNRMETISGLTDLKIRMREGRPEMRILVDKDRAASLDVSTQAVADQVHAAMRGLRATLYHEEGQEVETITRLDEKYRKTFRDLYKMVVSNRQGTPLLLEQVAQFRFDLGPSEIWRKDRERMIQVSANLGKVSLSKAVLLVQDRLADLQFPENYFYRIGGDYDRMIKSQSEMRWIILMVVMLVYLVLAALFESFTQPFLIMIAVPLALTGALGSLYVFGPKTIGIGALLGLMMLAGIVVNHSILLMDRINYYKRQKKYADLKAALAANRDRLRPILMTTATAILGLVPMATDRGEGANLWSPLALTVIGGLVSSMILTVLVMPAFYLVFIQIGRVLKEGNQRRNSLLKRVDTPTKKLL